MAKEKTTKAVQIVPVSNGWLTVTQETSQPNIPPKVEQTYYSTAAEACASAAEFLEPQVLQIVTGNN